MNERQIASWLARLIIGRDLEEVKAEMREAVSEPMLHHALVLAIREAK